VAAPNGQLELRVRGRGAGALALAHIRDRVEAAGGSLAHTSLNGTTALEVRLPAQATS
jgi:signal transduction histidine kinase